MNCKLKTEIYSNRNVQHSRKVMGGFFPNASIPNATIPTMSLSRMPLCRPGSHSEVSGPATPEGCIPGLRSRGLGWDSGIQEKNVSGLTYFGIVSFWKKMYCLMWHISKAFMLQTAIIGFNQIEMWERWNILKYDMLLLCFTRFCVFSKIRQKPSNWTQL